MSLLLGVGSIVTSQLGNLELAGWMIVWCGLLDVLDGLAARLLKATSEFGAEFDSMADLVAFGVPRDAMLEFSATSTGWSAATPRDGVAYRCFVFSGDAPQELDGAEQHEVVCQPDAAKANPALREMYEGSG